MLKKSRVELFEYIKLNINRHVAFFHFLYPHTNICWPLFEIFLNFLVNLRICVLTKVVPIKKCDTICVLTKVIPIKKCDIICVLTKVVPIKKCDIICVLTKVVPIKKCNTE